MSRGDAPATVQLYLAKTESRLTSTGGQSFSVGVPLLFVAVKFVCVLQLAPTFPTVRLNSVLLGSDI